MLWELQKNVLFLQIHLNDLEPISFDSKYRGKSLDRIQITIINYLIVKYNSMSIGVTIKDINTYFDYNCFREMNYLTSIGIINKEEHRVLGVIYSVVKNNLQYCK